MAGTRKGRRSRSAHREHRVRENPWKDSYLGRKFPYSTRGLRAGESYTPVPCKKCGGTGESSFYPRGRSKPAPCRDCGGGGYEVGHSGNLWMVQEPDRFEMLGQKVMVFWKKGTSKKGRPWEMGVLIREADYAGESRAILTAPQADILMRFWFTEQGVQPVDREFRLPRALLAQSYPDHVRLYNWDDSWQDTPLTREERRRRTSMLRAVTRLSDRMKDALEQHYAVGKHRKRSPL
jgi:hypothetical protein